VLRGAWGLWSKVVLWLCVLVCWAMVCGVSAQARTVHVFAGSFGSEGSGAGEFKEPRGVAVNDSTEPLVQSAAGDVYVVDKGDNRVERFSSSGSYLGQFDGSGTFEVEGKVETGAGAPTGRFSEPMRIAVDNSGSPLDPSNGDVYVVDNGHGAIDKFTETGAYVGQLTGFVTGEQGIVGVAVDPAGTLWVDEKNGAVKNFSDALANTFISSGSTVYGPGVQNLGVDSEDNLYLTLGLEQNVKVNSLGERVVDPFGPKEATFGIAVDSKHGEVYLDYDTSIGVFTLGGSGVERFGSGHFPLNHGYGGSRGVAVNASNGTVYGTAFTAGDVVVFDAVTLPTVSLTGLSEQSPRSVTLNGTVNPEGLAVTSCAFEFDTKQYAEGEAPHGSSEACKPAIVGSGSTPVAVSRRLEDLMPETKYYYRLVAENTGGASEVKGEFSTGPILGGEFVTNVASESATLNVPVDPNGDDTHYYFQFGRSASYEFDAPVSAPGVGIGSVPGVQNISVHVQRDLAPGVVYHYRVVVLQGGEEFVGPDRVFTTQKVVAGSVLADGRAWELVSPANKKGALIEPFSAVGDDIQAAANGSAITYLAAGPAVGEGPQGKINWSQTLSVRNIDGGWGSDDLSVPRRIPGGEELAVAGGAREEYDMFSPDLLLAVVEPLVSGTPPLSPGAPFVRTIYLRDNMQGGYTPLVWAGNVANPEEELVWGPESEEQLFFVTASADLKHILLASPHAFTPEAVYGGKEYLKHNQWNLYEWSAGALQLVNILPQSEGGEPTNRAEPRVRLADGNVLEGNPEGVNPSAVSSDGRRVAWDLGVPGEGGGYKGLYVRDMVGGKTLKVCGELCVFQWMSNDGSKVFFVEGGDLHLCEIELGVEIVCKYADLTVDHGAGESSGGVQRLVSDVSRDGSYVYFVATGVLAEASGAVSGDDNLYLLHNNGSAWSTMYIATLGPEDAKSWDKKTGDSIALQSDLSGISSRVSPGGRYLAFMSDRSLTGYDNTDAISGRADEEVYLFDAQSERLVCASCDPTGARPVGALDRKLAPLLVDRGENWAGSSLGGSISGWNKNFVAGSRYQPRYLFDSGRLFFSSADGLVPHATNGVENVYEYEPVGVGGCVEGVSSGSVVYVASSGGCVGLVSAGVSGQESAFFDASENGNDVFFITATKLVGADYDNGYDVYDAHVCSTEGVPCVTSPVPSPQCSSGDSCKAAPSPQPEIFGPAPSTTFSGVGNVTEEAKPTIKKPKKSRRKRKARKTRRARGAGKKRTGGMNGKHGG
jgi:hypothetical protein